MLELLRDPLWQFVGVILALVALGATLLIYRLQQQRKALSVDVSSQNQLLTVKEELEGRLQILYDGKPTKDIRLLVINVFNSGNVPITAPDFVQPLTLDTGGTSTILSAVITNADPVNLKATIDVDKHHVTLVPLLLNSKDSVTIKLLVSEFSDDVNIDGRIIGVRSISKVGTTTRFHVFVLIITFAFFLIGGALMLIFRPQAQVQPPTPIQANIGFGMIIVSYMVMLTVVTKNKGMMNALLRFLRPRRGERTKG